MEHHRDDLTDLHELIGGLDDPLLRMERARWVMRTAEDDLHAAVREARGQGASWTVIGDRLGMSRQAAHERFRDVVHA